jgi:hypothetical protein
VQLLRFSEIVLVARYFVESNPAMYFILLVTKTLFWYRYLLCAGGVLFPVRRLTGTEVNIGM